mgnify:CR=1 FL=1
MMQDVHGAIAKTVVCHDHCLIFFHCTEAQPCDILLNCPQLKTDGQESQNFVSHPSLLLTFATICVDCSYQEGVATNHGYMI